MIKVQVIDLRGELLKLSSALEDFKDYSNNFISNSVESMEELNSDFVDSAIDLLENMTDSVAPDLVKSIENYYMKAEAVVDAYESADEEIAKSTEMGGDE